LLSLAVVAALLQLLKSLSAKRAWREKSTPELVGLWRKRLMATTCRRHLVKAQYVVCRMAIEHNDGDMTTSILMVQVLPAADIELSFKG